MPHPLPGLEPHQRDGEEQPGVDSGRHGARGARPRPRARAHAARLQLRAAHRRRRAAAARRRLALRAAAAGPVQRAGPTLPLAAAQRYCRDLNMLFKFVV